MRNHGNLSNMFLFHLDFQTWIRFLLDNVPQKQWIMGLEWQVETSTLTQLWTYPAIFATFIRKLETIWKWVELGYRIGNFGGVDRVLTCFEPYPLGSMCMGATSARPSV